MVEGSILSSIIRSIISATCRLLLQLIPAAPEENMVEGIQLTMEAAKTVLVVVVVNIEVL